mgnify:CR=1 FL=1
MSKVQSAMRLFACRASSRQPGDRLIAEFKGKSIGIFNIGGRYYALFNRCPHRGAPLCQGRLTGTNGCSDTYQPRYERAGEILRCAWHGYEFDVTTGRALVDPRLQVRMYRTSIEDGDLFIYV